MSFGAGFQRSTQTGFGVMGWCNVLDHGVRGDGVTEDTPPLAALFTQLVETFGGGVVVLVPTINGYRFDEAVPVPAGITVLYSAGVKFTAAGLDASGGGTVWDMRQPSGTPGPAGPAGPAGAGVPTGGTVGQVLAKTGTADFATGWQ